ncbi:hypothetical protein ACNKHL_25550 [Shigella flexneri]
MARVINIVAISINTRQRMQHFHIGFGVSWTLWREEQTALSRWRTRDGLQTLFARGSCTGCRSSAITSSIEL